MHWLLPSRGTMLGEEDSTEMEPDQISILAGDGRAFGGINGLGVCRRCFGERCRTGRLAHLCRRVGSVQRRLCWAECFCAFLQNRIVDGPRREVVCSPSLAGACLLAVPTLHFSPKVKVPQPHLHPSPFPRETWQRPSRLLRVVVGSIMRLLFFFKCNLCNQCNHVLTRQVREGNKIDAFQRPIPACRSAVTHARYISI